MKTLVVGGSGATGRKLVEQLLALGQEVKVILRSTGNIPEHWKNKGNCSLVIANINEIGVEEMAGYIKDCQAVVSCLGHNMSMSGLFGKPRKLVRDAVQLLCDSIERNGADNPIKLVLMNTAGNRNKDLVEALTFKERIVIGLIRKLLPPHSDNEEAAEYLRVNIGQNNPLIKWVVLRPDSLINEEKVTVYKLYPSPIRSAIFNPGKTSRVNVGHAMAQLIVNDELWASWKGKMPVIYNEGSR
ncbi:NAD(P)-binding oxidoreductase [Cyclobacterium amurskyense]|uniref:NAD(P)-dependent oxidoreductase n=1 Tax=Cyclobacterium amurskyense TaxID=320787 RepID=UPI0030DD27F8|tara:strand:+ start:7524 stop:8252 length:729 start_codon:yes stop_codon:yes gene_type:complete